MSEMTNLFKVQDVNYRTEVFENFNEIENKSVDIDDIFINVDEKVPFRIQGGFKTKFISYDETVFLENYGNPFAELHMYRKTLVIEENENKIALKVFHYTNSRDVSKKYFRVRREIYYLTYNIKRKTFYSGELILKRKVKIKSKMSVHKTDLKNIMVYIQTSHFFKSDEKDNNENLKLRDEAMTLFLDRVSERSGLKFDKEDLSHGDKFYQLYLKSSGIKYPDAFSKFKIFYTPKKEIRQHGNNLVTWFMKSQNFKGTKIRELLNKYDNIDLNGLKIFYETFGQDLFNTINSESFLSAETPNYFAYYGSIIENISKKEKENIVKILNTTNTETLLNSLNDHIQYKTNLRRYGENVKITATNYDDYVKEHSEWSTLTQSYRSGLVTRFYGDDAYLIEKPINHEGETYYPVLLKTTEQYEEESMHQSNCVRTYSESPYCFIVSLRKEHINGDNRATIEFRYDTKQLKVVQKLGKYNKGLDDEWSEPIRQLLDFANYLYSKEMINLPTMVKKYPNGKSSKEVAIFKNEDNIHNMYPVWENQNTVSDYLLGELDNYNLFDELY
jgi:hypothetical protein